MIAQNQARGLEKKDWKSLAVVLLLVPAGPSGIQNRIIVMSFLQAAF